MKRALILILLLGLTACAGDDTETLLDPATILTINSPVDTCDFIDLDISIDADYLTWPSDKRSQSFEVEEGDYSITGTYYYTCNGGVTRLSTNINITVSVGVEGFEVTL